MKLSPIGVYCNTTVYTCTRINHFRIRMFTPNDVNNPFYQLYFFHNFHWKLSLNRMCRKAGYATEEVDHPLLADYT